MTNWFQKSATDFQLPPSMRHSKQRHLSWINRVRLCWKAYKGIVRNVQLTLKRHTNSIHINMSDARHGTEIYFDLIFKYASPLLVPTQICFDWSINNVAGVMVLAGSPACSSYSQYSPDRMVVTRNNPKTFPKSKWSRSNTSTTV